MNARKQFAEHLRGLSDAALLEKQRYTRTWFVDAESRGNMALSAVLYFDLAQITKEVARRSEKEKTI